MHTFWEKYKHSTTLKIILGWLLLILLQAIFTEISDDEAYYWVWSRKLDWGYFDHPPMVAWIIRAGTLFFSGELGVRLFAIFLHIATILLLWAMTDREKPLLFWGMLFAAPLVHAHSLLAVPDAPFIFFLALFLYFYQQFLKEDSWKNVSLLALATAGMLYCKYHALMALFFLLLSNLQLLKKPKFWAIVAISLLLYLPHLYWGWRHEFATLKFHLLERTRAPYELSFSFDYFLSVFLSVGLLTGIWVIIAAFRQKTSSNSFERSLYFLMTGVLGLLLVMSFRQRIEGNWAAATFLPMFLLGYKAISQSSHLKHFLTLSAISLTILLVARLYLVWDFAPSLRKLRPEFHGGKEFALNVAKKAGNRPAIFLNTYQLPSKYIFYTGKHAFGLNNIHYRPTHFDLMEEEEANLQGKEVLLLSYWVPRQDTITNSYKDTCFALTIPHFYSFNSVKFTLATQNRIFHKGDTLNLPLKIHNDYKHSVDWDKYKNANIRLACRFWKNQKQAGKQISDKMLSGMLEKERNDTLRIILPDSVGKYDFRIFLDYGGAYEGNGKLEKIEIVD